MCKLMAFSNGSKIKNLKLLVNRALPLITAADRHGFGWSAYGARGAYGERMTDLAHGYRLDVNKYAVAKLPITPTYNSFGTEAPITGGLLLHARTSTNHKTLLNTHPIQRNDWTLVHNGVVNNRGPDYKMLTTNDTEHLVHYLSTTGISDVERYLSGYYAFAAFDTSGRLHVGRDDNATLYVAWVRSIQSYIFATTQDLIEELCLSMKWKRGPIDALADNSYLILSGNEIVHQQHIKPRGYDRVEESKMSQSLHYLESSDKAKRGRLTEFEDDTRGAEAASYMDFGYSPEAIELFETQCASLDGGDRIFDEYNDQVELYEFKKMLLVERLACAIYRADGSLLDIEACARLVA